MRKKLFFILILFFFSIAFVKAQEPVFDFGRAYQDYLLAHNQYRDAHNEYITAKEQYLNYKTLTAKTLAFEQALNMLQKRDETIRTYLTTLRLKMAETTGISNYEQNVLYIKLDKEVSWHAEHRDKFSDANTLEELTSFSQETEAHYSQTETFAYQALGIILEGKENNLKNQIDEQIEALKEKISQIQEKGDKDTTKIERWLAEAEGKLNQSQEKLDEATTLLNSIKIDDRHKENEFEESQQLFEESHQYLKEANSYLEELIREIKTND